MWTWRISGQLRFAQAIALLCIGLSACTPHVALNTVTKLTKVVSEAAPGFSALAKDFYASCLRRTIWLYPSKDMSASPDGVLFRACAEAKSGATQWEHANQVVLRYVKALSDLAGGSAKTNYGFKTLATAIKGLGGTQIFPKDKFQGIDDYGGLLDDLVGMAFAAEREAAIRSFAKQTQKPLGIFLDLLGYAVDQYELQLRAERIAFDAVFVSLNNPKLPASAPDREKWLQLTQAIAEKKDAAAAYRDVLTTIRTAQQELFRAAGGSDAQETTTIIESALARLERDSAVISRALTH